MSEAIVAGLFSLAAVLVTTVGVRQSVDGRWRKILGEELDLRDRLPENSPYRQALEERIKSRLSTYAPLLEDRERLRFVVVFNLLGFPIGYVIFELGIWLIFGWDIAVMTLKASVLALGVATVVSAARGVTMYGLPNLHELEAPDLIADPTEASPAPTAPASETPRLEA